MISGFIVRMVAVVSMAVFVAGVVWLSRTAVIDKAKNASMKGMVPRFLTVVYSVMLALSLGSLRYLRGASLLMRPYSAGIKNIHDAVI